MIWYLLFGIIPRILVNLFGLILFALGWLFSPRTLWSRWRDHRLWCDVNLHDWIPSSQEGWECCARIGCSERRVIPEPTPEDYLGF